ncbi:ABC transporter ATP-binding protein [Lacimicrobium alkaliphilum]|uniref:Multidrug ABC transporter ATP-binding protein n=1 Tax=Lacimicrobium alkaliphilum TaxID=1526571 RepID=A0A0U3AII6_9ALTE|nr:ATP-binding cassette domain-containing protein [Lacimicrobium alkaliphilum]ALS97810.1 multidrug ABC transporter ATP-binding protein [Lacimicrobium alkaliphilum]
MISVTNLVKTFGNFKAVDSLSFEVRAGDVVGFLGPNGAGKSTTMKMLTGFLPPTSGEIRISDMAMDQSSKTIQKQIGYLPEGAPAYGDMTVSEFLSFIADIRGLRGQKKKDRMHEVIAQVQLDEVLRRPVENLSKGFKRRVGLAQAIIHDPDILILDEPTDGLDPNQKHQVRELIKNFSKDKIVIISTHILEEVTAVCNRAMIIAAGKMLFDASPADLQKKSRYYQAISLHFTQLTDISGLAELPGVEDMEVDRHNGRVTLFPEGQQDLMPAVSAYIRDRGLQVDTLYQEQGRLDDVFRQMTEEVNA